jgi:ArsR family metal-binding transcriptional regulator
MTDAVEKEICLAEVNELLKKMKEENCHPEPTCWDRAMEWLNGHLEECNTIEDPEEKQQCHEKGHAKYEAMAEECRI